MGGNPQQRKPITADPVMPCMYNGCSGIECHVYVVAFLVGSLLSSVLKGHSQLVHMRIRYHFLADLHITLNHKSRAEKRIL